MNKLLTGLVFGALLAPITLSAGIFSKKPAGIPEKYTNVLRNITTLDKDIDRYQGRMRSTEEFYWGPAISFYAATISQLLAILYNISQTDVLHKDVKSKLDEVVTKLDKESGKMAIAFKAKYGIEITQ